MIQYSIAGSIFEVRDLNETDECKAIKVAKLSENYESIAHEIKIMK